MHLFYIGSIIFHWDTDKEAVIATFDCSNKISGVDTHFYNKNRKFEGIPLYLVYCLLL